MADTVDLDAVFRALGDPTRREAVLRLLDDMERTSDTWQGPGRGMDPQRLRTLLGLT